MTMQFNGGIIMSVLGFYIGLVFTLVLMAVLMPWVIIGAAVVGIFTYLLECFDELVEKVKEKRSNL